MLSARGCLMDPAQGQETPMGRGHNALAEETSTHNIEIATPSSPEGGEEVVMEEQETK